MNSSDMNSTESPGDPREANASAGAEAPAAQTQAQAPSASNEPSDPELEGRVVEVLKTVYDPEIPVNIYELGLIYELAVDQNGHARVVMTLTSPHCPVAESLPAEVKQKIAAMEGIQHVDLDITWDPPWGQEKMSEAAKLALGMI